MKSFYDESHLTFPEKYCSLLLRISFFLKWTPWISSQYYDDPLEFFNFLHLPFWESSFFPQILTYPPGIPTTFNIPPGNFYWYSQQGVSNFFLGKPVVSQQLFFNIEYPYHFYFLLLYFSLFRANSRVPHSLGIKVQVTDFHQYIR